MHDPRDTDASHLAGHHTLGLRPTQALPGNAIELPEIQDQLKATLDQPMGYNRISRTSSTALTNNSMYLITWQTMVGVPGFPQRSFIATPSSRIMFLDTGLWEVDLNIQVQPSITHQRIEARVTLNGSDLPNSRMLEPIMDGNAGLLNLSVKVPIAATTDYVSVEITSRGAAATLSNAHLAITGPYGPSRY